MASKERQYASDFGEPKFPKGDKYSGGSSGFFESADHRGRTKRLNFESAFNNPGKVQNAQFGGGIFEGAPTYSKNDLALAMQREKGKK